MWRGVGGSVVTRRLLVGCQGAHLVVGSKDDERVVRQVEEGRLEVTSDGRVDTLDVGGALVGDGSSRTHTVHGGGVIQHRKAVVQSLLHRQPLKSAAWYYLWTPVSRDGGSVLLFLLFLTLIRRRCVGLLVGPSDAVCCCFCWSLIQCRLAGAAIGLLLHIVLRVMNLKSVVFY